MFVNMLVTFVLGSTCVSFIDDHDLPDVVGEAALMQCIDSLGTLPSDLEVVVGAHGAALHADLTERGDGQRDVHNEPTSSTLIHSFTP